jgi:excisionase family DNA binding protein
MPEPSYSLDELAESQKCHALTLRREIARGKLEAVRIGRQIRVTESAWNAYMEARRIGAPRSA